MGDAGFVTGAEPWVVVPAYLPAVVPLFVAPEVLPEFVFPLFCGFCGLVREVIEFGLGAAVFVFFWTCFEATEVGAFAFFSGGSAKIGYAVASSAYTV